MPEDIPKAVFVLIWLLSGVIIFGWLLMAHPEIYSFVFALIYFGLPVAAYKTVKKNRT